MDSMQVSASHLLFFFKEAYVEGGNKCFIMIQLSIQLNIIHRFIGSISFSTLGCGCISL